MLGAALHNALSGVKHTGTNRSETPEASDIRKLYKNWVASGDDCNLKSEVTRLFNGAMGQMSRGRTTSPPPIPMIKSSATALDDEFLKTNTRHLIHTLYSAYFGGNYYYSLDNKSVQSTPPTAPAGFYNHGRDVMF